MATTEKIELVERHAFWSRRQRAHESMLAYLQELERLAATCNFASRLDENLRDQFASGLLDSNIRKKIFASKVKTKDDVVNLAQDLDKGVVIIEDENQEINDYKVIILYQNVQGIKDKLKNTFKDNLKRVLGVQFVGVTETFLDNSVSESEFSGGVWDIFKRDRTFDPKNPPINGVRGGVLLAVKPNIKAIRRTDLETASGEDLWISFSLNNHPVYLCLVYFKASAAFSDYKPFLLKIKDEVGKLEGTIVIVGDANLNSTKTDFRSIFVGVMKECGFVNVNDVINEIGTKVDVVYVKGGGYSKVCRAAGVVREVRHHPPLQIELCVPQDEEAMAI